MLLGFGPEGTELIQKNGQLHLVATRMEHRADLILSDGITDTLEGFAVRVGNDIIRIVLKQSVVS
jgi:hypothetical protein